MKKLEDAKQILSDLELSTKQQNDRSAYTLLALADIGPQDSWSSAKIRLIGINEIINFIAAEYDFQYAPNSRESIRRQTIHQFEQAGIIERNADDPTRATNSGKTVYSLTKEAIDLIQSFNTGDWDSKLKNFIGSKESLADLYTRKREVHRVPIQVEGRDMLFSSGEHNILQKLIVEEFSPRFAKGAKLLYIGDTANKNLYKLDKELEILGIPITQHDKLPDVVLYDLERDWLFLCEAVTSHGPVSSKRFIELEEMLKDCRSGKVYVSCFLNMQIFKKYADDIAWETEIWISEMPDHMIHFNGDRFMGPR